MLGFLIKGAKAFVLSCAIASSFITSANSVCGPFGEMFGCSNRLPDLRGALECTPIITERKDTKEYSEAEVNCNGLIASYCSRYTYLCKSWSYELSVGNADESYREITFDVPGPWFLLQEGSGKTHYGGREKFGVAVIDVTPSSITCGWFAKGGGIAKPGGYVTGYCYALAQFSYDKYAEEYLERRDREGSCPDILGNPVCFPGGVR